MVDFEQLFAEHESLSKAASQQLNRMLETLSSGHIPTEQNSFELDESIASLRNNYFEIKNAAAPFFDEEIIDDGLTVRQIVDMAKRGIADQLREKIEAIEETIGLFVQVQAKTKDYADALLQYQNDAQALLDNLRNHVEAASGSLDAEMSRIHLFMEALQVDDLGNSGAIMDSLEESFSPKVNLGLILHKYYLAEGRGENNFPNHDFEPAASESHATGARAQDGFDQEALTQNELNNDGSSKGSSALEPTKEDEARACTESQQCSIAADGLYRFKGTTAEFKSLISSMKSQEKSDSGFVLPLLTNIGAATVSQIIQFGFHLDHWNEENDDIKCHLDATISLLCKKGAVVSYKGTVFDESVICLTPFALENLGKRFIQSTMANIWSISFGKVKLTGKRNMDAETLRCMVDSNDNLLTYLDWAKNAVSAETYELIKQSITWQGECYTVLVPWGTRRVSCGILDHFDGSDNRLVIGKAEGPDCALLHQHSFESLFLLFRRTLSKWNGEWVSEAVDSDEQSDTEATNDTTVDCEVGPMTHDDDTPDGSDSLMGEEPQEASEDNTANSHSDTDVMEFSIEPDKDEEALAPSVNYGSASEYAKMLLDREITPDDKNAYLLLVKMLISEGKIVSDGNTAVSSVSQALVLLKALSVFDVAYKNDYLRYAMAVDSTIEKLNYSGDNMIELFGSDESNDEDLLLLLSLLRALFTPSQEFDYSLRPFAQSCFDDFEKRFSNYEYLKALFNLLLKLNNGDYGVFGGFTQQVLLSFSKAESKQNQMSQIQETAKRLLSAENVVISGMNAMLPMKDLCFGRTSVLGTCLAAVAANRREDYELVEMAYSEFCTEGEAARTVSLKKVDDYCDECWKKAVDKVKSGGKRGGPRDLKNRQRVKVINEINDRLEVIESWLSIAQRENVEKVSNPKLNRLRDEMIAEIDSIQESLSDSPTCYETALVLTLLGKIKCKLEGDYGAYNHEFADLLRTGIFCLDDSGRPVVDELFSSYRYYEPWRNALKHIAAPVVDFESVLEEICNPNSKDLYDNIGQAVQICDYLNRNGNHDVSGAQYKSDVDSARRSSLDELNKFKGNLELAFMYGRIQEPLREDLSEGVEMAFEFLSEYQNYACIRAMLASMHRVIDEDTEFRREELASDIENRRRGELRPEQEILLTRAEAELQAPRFNFVLAEEYLNRFDSDVSDLMDISDTPEDNHYLNFINERFDELYKLCLSNKMKRRIGEFGWKYTQPLLSRKQFSSQYQNESKEFLEALPASASAVNSDKIIKLLRSIGFRVRSATVVTPRTDDMVRITVEVFPDSKNKTEFSHPIDIMGTKIVSPINVICLYGWKQANDIVEKVCRKELHGTAIVFLNGALSSESRRELAEKFHRNKTGMNSFLLIDWVLMLYLAQFEAAGRLPVMLNCTLPYASSYKPFVLKGSVSDEMFIGRKRELNQILDPRGPVIVYGGRQLGKTALLERAQSYADDPSKKEYAFLIRATETASEEKLVSEIVSEMEQQGLRIGNVSSTVELRKELRASYRKGNWKRILLLIDEADKVLESMAPKYSPIIALSDLSHDTGNDFKFVFAGLHNVCRAANEPNTIFGQLGAPLCITPLSLADAYELLVRPLRYMGFTIDAETIMRVLVNTSFYPGIVHAVGYSLVENLTTRYSLFYRASKGNPPYSLTDEQLRGVISGEDLNDKIDERIRWTLQVDPRYFMLARCIAYLYYDEPENNKQGHSVDMIAEYAELLGITCLESLSKDAMVSLLKEMGDMGILVEPAENCFRLRQRRFLTAIGRTREVIEADIEKEQGASV